MTKALLQLLGPMAVLRIMTSHPRAVGVGVNVADPLTAAGKMGTSWSVGRWECGRLWLMLPPSQSFHPTPAPSTPAKVGWVEKKFGKLSAKRQNQYLTTVRSRVRTPASPLPVQFCKMGDTKKHEADVDEYSIKPQAVAPALDTSQWPLLLKNFDRRQSYFQVPYPRGEPLLIPQLQSLFEQVISPRKHLPDGPWSVSLSSWETVPLTAGCPGFPTAPTHSSATSSPTSAAASSTLTSHRILRATKS